MRARARAAIRALTVLIGFRLNRIGPNSGSGSALWGVVASELLLTREAFSEGKIRRFLGIEYTVPVIKIVDTAFENCSYVDAT